MNLDEPPDSNLERILKESEIKIRKRRKPLLYPKKFQFKYTSLRNPGATIFNNQIILLVTVRYRVDNKSRIHIAKSSDGENFYLESAPFIDTDSDSRLGTEDARITRINDKYYITFTAFKETINEVNTTRIGLVETTDFNSYSNRRIILDDYGNNKNAIIFPIGKIYYIFHRPFSGNSLGNPSVRVAITKDFKEFEDLGEFLKPRKKMWDDARVGINTPPIRIQRGNNEYLFFLYHGASMQGNIYRIGYILTTKHPVKIVERSFCPILQPELEWEKGSKKYPPEVRNVVFGNGKVVLKNQQEKVIRFFYSGSDRYLSYSDIKLLNTEIVEEAFYKEETLSL